MPELKNLLVEQLQDLLNAENQIVGALPKMVDAARNAKLKQTLEKHLLQTEGQVKRLQSALQLVGGAAESRPCKGMQGLLEEGEETIAEGEDHEELTADLALIAAAQKVEHYEISGYGTARCVARQLNELEVATLLSHTLGEEEAADFLLSEVAKPLLQQATLREGGDRTKTPWGEPGETAPKPLMGQSKARATASSGAASFKSKKAKA